MRKSACVMAGLVPAIHAVPPQTTCEGRALPTRVDSRDKPGHDGAGRLKASPA
jgi:hypothetical protein